MLNILSILNYVLNQLKLGDVRFVKVDPEHLLDLKTGVTFHLYDDYFKIKHDDMIIAKSNYFTTQEQQVIWDIKRHMQDPETMKLRMEEYPMKVRAGREHLSALFSNPAPVVNKGPIVEEGTTDYAG